MAEWVHYFNFGAGFSALTTALLGLLLALTAPFIQRWERWYFRTTFTMLLCYAAADLIAQASLSFLDPGFMWLSQAGIFLELLFSTMIIPLITAYLLRSSGESWRSSPLFLVVSVLWVLYAIVLVIAQFGEGIYSISADNRLILTGPFYNALVIPPILLMIINLLAIIRRRAALTHRQRQAFFIYTIIPLVSVLLQAVLFDLRIVVFGTSIATLAMFGFVLVDQTEAHVRQREEAARRQAQVMALQMRPHFIYNVMTSLYYICAQDPKRAQQVTFDFTNYLRANFDAVAQESEVPFSKELEHTRAYLSVEQARLENALVVDIDCPHTAFRLPPLTLQPLVENAVKHGADPELPPLHVNITSKKEADCSIIMVEDTGPGFDEAPQADGTASALDNIRERLATHGSSLEISPRQRGGTVAIMRIPTKG